MMDMEFDFGDSPWETWLASKKPGDSLNAAQLLSFLEEETEEAVEDAFAAIAEKNLLLDITALPRKQYVGQAALRLRQEAQMAEGGMDTAALSENDPLRLYLEEIQSIAPKTEEKTLLQKAAQGDEGAQEELTSLGLSRVAELARECVGYGVLLMDLIQEGSLGLWQAVQAYRGGDYSAQRDRAIRESMAKAITIQARNNGVGQKMRQALEDYRAVDQRLLGELGRNPTLEEIALEMHITPEEAATVKRNLDDASMLDKATAQPAEEQESEEDQAVEDTAYFQTRQRIQELLSVLPEVDARLLSLRFGLDGEKPMSPEEAGRRLGLTPQEVLDREAKALTALRQEQ